MASLCMVSLSAEGVVMRFLIMKKMSGRICSSKCYVILGGMDQQYLWQCLVMMLEAFLANGSTVFK